MVWEGGRHRLTAQAKQVKRRAGSLSFSPGEHAQAEPQEGQADNVATPVQEQLPNQQVCDVLVTRFLGCCASTAESTSLTVLLLDAGGDYEDVSGRPGLLERCDTKAEGWRWGR